VDNKRSFADKCIVNQNDVYLYFEMVRQIKPERIIDAGMFLKRIGAVSRQAMGMEIGRNVEICGIDAMPKCSAGVYSIIYDSIWSIKDFTENEGIIESDKNTENIENGKNTENIEKCTLAFMLRTEGCFDDYNEKLIVSRIAGEASYLVADDACYERNKELFLFKSCRELALDDDNYKIVIF